MIKLINIFVYSVFILNCGNKFDLKKLNQNHKLLVNNNLCLSCYPINSIIIPNNLIYFDQNNIIKKKYILIQKPYIYNMNINPVINPFVYKTNLILNPVTNPFINKNNLNLNINNQQIDNKYFMSNNFCQKIKIQNAFSEIEPKKIYQNVNITNTNNAFSEIKPNMYQNVNITNTNNAFSEIKPSIYQNVNIANTNNAFSEIKPNNICQNINISSIPFSENKSKSTFKNLKIFDCEINKKKFNRRSNLKQNLLNIKGFECNVNNKSFRQKQDHYRTHIGERPFVCDFCDKRFKIKHKMKTHRRIHTGEKPYGCILCFKNFTSKSSLNGHAKNKH